MSCSAKPPAEGEGRALVLTRAAAALVELGRYGLAGELADVALGLAPGHGPAHAVRAAVLDAAGEAEAALQAWRRAADLQPGEAQARLNLALALLARGRLAEGLPLYEARTEKSDWVAQATRESMAALAAKRLRPGDALAGKRVVVVTEQGLGDCILFARYVPVLAAAGAEVVLVCPPALRPLFAGLGGMARLLSPPEGQPFAKVNLAALEFDVFVPMGSLPLVFGGAAAGGPYLRADAAAVAGWRSRYAAAGRAGHRRVGLVFRANPASRSGEERSIPETALAPLRDVAGVDFVCLQAGEAGRALAASWPGMIDALAEPVGLDEFAAAVAATDALVSVDTMAAHCAAAMGHPVWVMTRRQAAWCWRGAWYPEARVVSENWDAVVKQVKEELFFF